MAQTTIQGGFLAADLVSAQTALTTGLATTDEIIVSDAGVIKRMDISVIEIAGTQVTSGLVADARIAATLSRITATETLSSKSIDLGTNTLTGSIAEFNAALQSESFATLGGTETLIAKTLTTPTISSTGWTNALHAHAANNSGGTLSASILTGALPAISGENLTNLPAGGIASVAADTTPQVGGSAGFDLQAQLLVGNGGTTGIAISANGEVTMAAQPAVAAFNSVTEANVTGTASGFVTVDFNTEIYDQNEDFLNDTFTAPVTGRYLILAQIAVGGVTADASSCAFRTAGTGNRVWFTDWGDWGNGPLGTTYTNKHMIADMDANDNIRMTIEVAGESSDIVDILGYSSPETHISICLLA